jgi:tetratricopeptide (TPR) repeat protein
MSEKKKSPPPKTVEKRFAKPVHDSLRASDGDGAAAVSEHVSGQKQLATFESAMKLFHARKLREARELFRDAAEGPERDVAQRARLHIAMCDRRLEQAQVSMSSAEDYYNYGVTLLNQRNPFEARRCLEKAHEMSPNADHICYALAAAQAQTGDPQRAYENLKRAIDLEPRNRAIARQDGDFGALAHQPPFDTLLHPEKKNW